MYTTIATTEKIDVNLVVFRIEKKSHSEHTGQLFLQAVQLGLNIPSNFWIIVNEDISLLSVTDGSSWVNANILSLHYHYPLVSSRQYKPVDAHLLGFIPANATV